MTARILHVSGSIALGDTPVAWGWSIARCLDALVAVRPHLVVHGDADGGDRAAEVAASQVGVPTLAWPKAYGATRRAELRIGLGEPPPPVILADAGDLPAYDGHPLKRDQAMVAWCEVRHKAGVEVTSLGLFAPWCPRFKAGRGGTRYTMRLARTAGFRLRWHVCPLECGPTEGR